MSQNFGDIARYMGLLCIVGTQFIWIVTSPFSPRENIKQMVKRKVVVGTFFSGLLLLQLLDILEFPLPFDLPFELKTLGIILTILGSTFAIWGKLTMKEVWGIPAQHDKKRQNKLITNGPFSYSRNPIYVGLISMFVGIELSLASVFILFALPLILLIHKGVLKEEMLLNKYFKEYASYRKRIPRYL